MSEPVPTHALLGRIIAEILPSGEPHIVIDYVGDAIAGAGAENILAALSQPDSPVFTPEHAKAAVFNWMSADGMAHVLNERLASLGAERQSPPSRRFFLPVGINEPEWHRRERHAKHEDWRVHAANCGVE